MAALPTQKPLLAGAVPVFSAAGVGGDSFVNTGNEWLIVRDGGGAPTVVTIDGAGTDNFGIANNDVFNSVVPVAAGEEKWIGPFPTNRFNDANGSVQISYSATTGVTVAAVRAY